jgi:hypothetical protein
MPRLDALPEKAATLFRGIAEASAYHEAAGAAAARVIGLYTAAGRPGRALDFYLELLAVRPLESYPEGGLRALAAALADLAESWRKAGQAARASSALRHLFHPAYGELRREFIRDAEGLQEASAPPPPPGLLSRPRRPGAAGAPGARSGPAAAMPDQ